MKLVENWSASANWQPRIVAFYHPQKIRTHQYLRPSSLHRSPGASLMRTMIFNIYWMNPCTSLVSKSRAYTNTSVSSLEFWILSSPWLGIPQLHLYSLANFLRWAAASKGWSSPLHSPPVRQVLPWRSYYYSYFHSARASLPPLWSSVLCTSSRSIYKFVLYSRSGQDF